LDLHFEISGNGHPVVLIHSGGTDLRLWTFISPLLAKNYQVIAFDGRGAGKSPSPLKDTNYVEELLALMEHLKLIEATIIGHSMGGQIATDFALNYPERVSKLIVIAPSLTGFPYSSEFADYHSKVAEAAPNVEKMLEVAINSPTYQVVKNSPQKDLNVQMLRQHFGRMLEWPADNNIIWPQPPAIERLEELNTETLFIIGDQDLADNYRVADCFRKVSNIRFIEMQDGDHLLPLTHFETIVQEITGFLED